MNKKSDNASGSETFFSKQFKMHLLPYGFKEMRK